MPPLQKPDTSIPDFDEDFFNLNDQIELALLLKDPNPCLQIINPPPPRALAIRTRPFPPTTAPSNTPSKKSTYSILQSSEHFDPQTGLLTENFINSFSVDDIALLSDLWIEGREPDRVGGEGWVSWVKGRGGGHTVVEWVVFWEYFVKRGMGLFDEGEGEDGEEDDDAGVPEGVEGNAEEKIFEWKDLIPQNNEKFDSKLDPRIGKLTPWAEKYGHSREAPFAITGQNYTPRKSGFTPSPTAFGTWPPLSPISQAKKADIDATQIKELRMPVRDLVDWGIIEVEGLKRNNLVNEICPIFEKENWRKEAGTQKMPKVFGDRLWSVDIPEVWDVLLPILRLCTLLLSNCHINEWWDALVSSIDEDRLKPVDLSRTTLGHPPLWYFEPRPPEFRSETPIKWARFRDQIAWKIVKSQNVKLGRASFAETHYSKSTTDFARFSKDRSVIIHLNHTMLLPLLGKLSEGERLSQNFKTAVTICHELAHTYWRLTRSEWVEHTDPATGNVKWTSLEPYYRDESVSELGKSMENGLFGGRVTAAPFDPRHQNLKSVLASKSRGIPVLVTRLSPWPHFNELSGNLRTTGPFAAPTLDMDKWTNQPSSAYYKFIPVTWCEEIQQKEFWEFNINKFGGDYAKPYPVMRGQVLRRDAAGEVRKSVWNSTGGIAEAYPKLPNNSTANQLDDTAKKWLQRSRARSSDAILKQRLRKEEAERKRIWRRTHTTANQKIALQKWKTARKVFAEKYSIRLKAEGKQLDESGERQRKERKQAEDDWSNVLEKQNEENLRRMERMIARLPDMEGVLPHTD